MLRLCLISCPGMSLSFLFRSQTPYTYAQTQVGRWPMALSVWTVLKISACKGGSAEISSDLDISLSFLPSFWQRGGMEVGVAELKGVHSLKQGLEESSGKN